MLFIVRVLAVSGAIAVLVRAVLALLSLMRGGVDMFLARDLHEVRAQRGDLTGMEEAVALRHSGRQRRARALATLSFWIGLLVVPFFTPWPAYLLAAYSLLWLVRGRRGTGVRVTTHVGTL